MTIRYAQLGPGGVCIGVSALLGQVEAPGLIEIAEGVDPTGKRWNGAAFVAVAAVAPTAAELADAELRAIDAGTGLSRTAREVLIAVGKKVGADVSYLEAQEAKAIAARAKRGGG